EDGIRDFHVTGVQTCALPISKLKLLGVDVASIGDAQGRTPGSQSYVFSDGVAGIYKRLIVSADGKKLLGAVLVGDVEAYGTLQRSEERRVGKECGAGWSAGQE